MRHVPGNRWIPLAERFWAKVEKRSGKNDGQRRRYKDARG